MDLLNIDCIYLILEYLTDAEYISLIKANRRLVQIKYPMRNMYKISVVENLNYKFESIDLDVINNDVLPKTLKH